MHDEDATTDEIATGWTIPRRSAHPSTSEEGSNVRCAKSLVIHVEHVMTHMGGNICLTGETTQMEILGALHAEDFMERRGDLGHRYRDWDVSTFTARTWTDGAHVATRHFILNSHRSHQDMSAEGRCQPLGICDATMTAALACPKDSIFLSQCNIPF